MKKLITLTLLLLSVSLSTEADSTGFHHHHHGGFHIGFIESREQGIDTIGQEFNVVYRTYFADTVDIPVLVKLALPTIPDSEPLPSESSPFFTFPGSGNEITGSYVAGDSIIDSLTVSFNKLNIPFYYQVLELQVWDSAGDYLLTSTKFMVYFTPWNTIEVWNDFDFENLHRIWMSHTNSHEDRIYFHKDSLPDTDLTFEEFINDSIPKSYYSPEGLGYLIPIHYVDDESELMMRRDDGCPGNQKKWVGDVSGKIRVNVLPDFAGQNEDYTDLNIAGIKVTIMQREGSWLRTDKNLGTTYTNSQGEFSLSVNRCFRGGVGDEIELYIFLESTNSDRSIIVRKRVAGVRTEAVSKHVFWEYNHGQQSNLNMGSFWPSTSSLKPQLLHWANRCRTFVNQELVSEGFNLGSSGDPLIILKQPLGSGGAMFIPGGYLTPVSTLIVSGVAAGGLVVAGPTGLLFGTALSLYLPLVMTNKDGIYMENSGAKELDEDLMYHEFGHYLMWHLQDESWINPLEASWAEHGFHENCNNPKIAWTEGWAGGIGAIFDIAFKDDDGEAGRVWSTNLETRIGNFSVGRVNNDNRSPEDFVSTIRLGSSPGENIQNNVNTVTHGFVSEMNIVCAILDLFDGPGKGNILALGGAETHDDDDGTPQDLVSLTFAQICKPLLNNQGVGFLSSVVIQNAMHYAYELTRSLPCDLRQEIYPIWRFNRIRDFEDPPTQLTSTDVISDAVWIETELFKNTGRKADNDQGAFLKSNGTYYQIYRIDVPEINTNTGSFNLVQPQPGWGEYITDPLIITDERRLMINNNVSSNWNDPNLLSASTLSAYFCNIETRFNDGGELVVGDWDSTSDRYANAYIGKNSTVVLEGGTNPSVLIINNKSKLTIEPGGVLEVHPGARIILNGTNAVLEVKGEIRMMENADFTVEGGAQGFGYIKFHKDYNATTPKLITGMGNNNIILEGDGASHKLIEITGDEGWFVPNHFTDVSISNCIVTLGAGSRMNMENGNKLAITNVEMKKILVGQDRHKGLYVWSWGMYSEIDNLTVSGGIQGIYYYPINDDKDHSDLKVRYAVKTHVVKNSRFEDNLIGIKSIRVPVWMINNEFDGYQTHGVRTYGSLGRNMYLLDNKLDNSGSNPLYLDIGLSYWGGLLSTLHLRRNEISENHQAFYAFQTRIIAGCNHIHDNSTIAMIVEGHSDLYINHGYDAAGRNLIEDNNSNILSRYNGRFAMEGGLNTFSAINSSTTATLPFFISGHLPSVYSGTSSLFDVVDNVFSPSLAPETNPTFFTQFCNSTNNWEGYVIDCAHPQLKTALFYNRNIPPTGLANVTNPTTVIAVTECNESFWSDLPELVNGLPKVYTFPEHFPVKWNNFFGASAYLVNTPDYTNTPIKDVANDLYQRATELDGETPSDIIDIYEDVLINTYVPSDSFHHVFYELYSQFLGNVNHWINTGDIDTRVSDSLQEDAVFGQVLDLIDDLILASSGDSSHFLFGQEFNLKVEKAELMRAASNYSQALLFLNNITAIEPIEIFIIDKLTCLNNAEKDLFSGAVSADSLFDVYGECLDAYFDDPFFDTTSGDLKMNFIQEKIKTNIETIQVWPNPAQNELNINILSEDLKPEYEIYNLVGNKVMSGNLKSGVQQVNLSSISNGIYFFKINSGKEVKSFKIVVMK